MKFFSDLFRFPCFLPNSSKSKYFFGFKVLGELKVPNLPFFLCPRRRVDRVTDGVHCSVVGDEAVDTVVGIVGALISVYEKETLALYYVCIRSESPPIKVFFSM